MTPIHPLRLLFAASILSCTQLPAEVSQLWGVAGEKWTPESRLPDFSFAGYRRGEEAFRIPPSSISVADFGAKGDGRTDDTAAFKRASASGQGKVILIPAGRFVLSDILEIHSSNLVLRGAGSGRTVLLFTRSLEALRPRPVKNDGGTPTSGWSWGGGLITIGDPNKRGIEPYEGSRRITAYGGSTSSGEFTRITAPALRGANRLTLEKPLFKAGDEVELMVRDTADKSLLNYLYHNQTGNMTGLKNWQCRQIFRVQAVAGNQVKLDRGLRFDVRSEWKPTLEPFHPAVTDVGLEGVSFEFPATPYAGHFKEAGWNPVAIRASAAHCWLKDLIIRNGDNGPFLEGCAFCTIDGIRVLADPSRKGRDGKNGHHGITLEGDDCLCTHFSMETQFVHDLTVQSALGCVFSSGRAVNLNMDHHCWASYENLYTNIDAGSGARLFESSGGGDRGLHTAAGATFWNIRAQKTVTWPRGFGPDAINLIGLPVSDPQTLSATGRWLERIPPDRLQPANLHAAMLARRLKALHNHLAAPIPTL